MERWAVVLDGSSIDLDNASRCFGHAGSRSVRIGTIETFNGGILPALFADSFGVLSRPEDVQEEAVRLLDLISGILFVGDQGREPIRIVSVHPHTPEGWGQGYSFIAGSVKVRSSASGNLSGGSPVEPPEFRWMELAQTEEEVRDVLLFLRAPEPDWFDLYKVSELLASAKERQAWLPASRFRDFGDSAQFDRHARGRYEAMDPAGRMDLGQARDFIRDMARQWLDWWRTDEAGARAASRENVNERRKPRKKT